MNFSPEDVRNIQFRGEKKIYLPVDYSEEDLIDFMRKRNVKTIGQLKKAKGRKPSIYAFRKVFGSWSEAKKTAFGEEIDILGGPPGDLGYIIKVINDYKVTGVSKYIKLRKDNPSIFPSSYHLYKFGGFKKIKKISELYSVGDHLEAYAKLKRKLNRIPTPEECRREHIVIDELLSFFGSRRKLNDFLDSVENIN